MRQFRREIQVIFRDPYASLNPRMTVGEIVAETWEVFPDILARSERPARAGELLTRVGLHPASPATRTRSPVDSASGSASPAPSRSTRR
jgi:ABC-type microcin C transport system duplicated ATPase subunit YejF